MHGLDRPSLSVSLNADWFAFDRRYLWGPEPFAIPALRFYTHEVLHFWQVLASGFVANLALAEWRALREWVGNPPELDDAAWGKRKTEWLPSTANVLSRCSASEQSKRANALAANWRRRSGLPTTARVFASASSTSPRATSVCP